MATETVKSTLITNLDATPPVRATGGYTGGAQVALVCSGDIAPTNGSTSTSVYQMVRLPSTAIVKRITGDFTGTITTFTTDITLHYSDNTLDEVGAGAGNSGLVNSLSGASSLFDQAYAWGGGTAGVPVDLTNKSGNYDGDKRNKQLWDAAGLSSDPGGAFDIVLRTTATNNVSGAKVWLMVEFEMPYSG